MLFETLTLVLDRQPHLAALNMAIDEVLLRNSPVPVLRIYEWERPALSFGYFGNFEEVSRKWNGRELVRRWTGGGEVPHGDDLTYTLVVPKPWGLPSREAAESYNLIHQAVARSLPSSPEVSLAPQTVTKVSGACFENPARHDIILDGRKIAGAAQRRTQHGLLHQGSIQMKLAAETFGGILAGELANDVSVRETEHVLLREAAELAQVKYATDQWLRKF